MSEKKQVDWERIELQYRAGILTLREIAAENGVTHGAINKRANRDGWSRDLGAKIKAKAEELVSKSLVSTEVSNAKKVSERQMVEAGAEAIVRVKSKHKRHIDRAWENIAILQDEQESLSLNHQLYLDVAEIVKGEGADADRQMSMVRRVLELPNRIDGQKKIVEMIKTNASIERDTYDIAGPTAKTEAKVTLDSTKRLHELTDAELHAIATASGAGTSDSASSAD